MHISKNIISIPPYISTSWSNVKALRMDSNTLVIQLNNGDDISVPDLQPETVESVFTAHAASLDQDEHKTTQSHSSPGFAQSVFGSDDMSFRFGFAGLEGIGSAMQHNPAQMNAPDLPHEVLEKIASIAKVIAPNDPNAIPKPEPHCNCMHCQIARTIHNEINDQEDEPEYDNLVIEEEVSDEELSFCQWEIKQTGDKLYTVTNRLDTQEKYSVYLGHPIGCTCGKDGCDHIVAVLRH